MQNERLDEQRRALLSILADFPNFEVEALGMEPTSARNWFRIRDRVTGKGISVRSLRTADFSTARFTSLLSRFASECDGRLLS
jgi:hypothetical protein